MRVSTQVILGMVLAGVLILGAQRAMRHAAQEVRSSTDTLRGQIWSEMATRTACTDVAHLAVRRATVVALTFTRIEYEEGTWSARGVVQLADAPGGLTHAAFTCELTDRTDQFVVEDPDLTVGP